MSAHSLSTSNHSLDSSKNMVGGSNTPHIEKHGIEELCFGASISQVNNEPLHPNCQIEEQAFTGEGGSHTELLPPELLSKIFIGLSEDWPSVYYTNEDNTKSHIKLEWANVLHVCRRWRAVALITPYLWTDLNLLLPKWAEMLLQRSKNLPISFTIPPSSPEASENLLLELVPKPHLWKYLLISLDQTEVAVLQYIFQELINISTPNLETLIVSGFTSLAISLHGIIAKGAPRLRRLEIDTTKPIIPWTSPLLTNLTTLDLMSYEATDNENVDPSDFLDALDRMPNLDYLNVEFYLPSTLHEIESDRIVQLCHLRMLLVAAETMNLEALFKYIAFPSTTCISISCDAITALAPSVYIPPIISTINSAWFSADYPISHRSQDSQRGAPDVYRLAIRRRGALWVREGFDLIDTRITVHPIVPDMKCEKPIWVIIAGGIPSLAQDLMTFFPLDRLVAFLMESPLPKEVIHVFGSLSSLERVALTEDCVDSFLDYVLQEDSFLHEQPNMARSDPHSVRRPTCFAKLDIIFLSDTNRIIGTSERKLQPFLEFRSKYGQCISIKAPY